MTGVHRGGTRLIVTGSMKRAEKWDGLGTWLLGLLQCTVWHLNMASRFPRVYSWLLELIRKKINPFVDGLRLVSYYTFTRRTEVTFARWTTVSESQLIHERRSFHLTLVNFPHSEVVRLPCSSFLKVKSPNFSPVSL